MQNSVGDYGGMYIAKALERNKSVRDVNLGRRAAKCSAERDWRQRSSGYS